MVNNVLVAGPAVSASNAGVRYGSCGRGRGVSGGPPAGCYWADRPVPSPTDYQCQYGPGGPHCRAIGGSGNGLGGPHCRAMGGSGNGLGGPHCRAMGGSGNGLGGPHCRAMGGSGNGLGGQGWGCGGHGWGNPCGAGFHGRNNWGQCFGAGGHHCGHW